MDQNLNVIPKSTKLLDIGINLWDPGLGNDFLDIIAKHEEFKKCFQIELQY